MARPKKLPRQAVREIRDHRDNTAKDLIKCYTLSQLALLEGVDTRTIKKSKKFLPVRIDNTTSLYRYSIGKFKKPYSIMYIRLDEIKFIFNKKSWQKLVVE